MSRIWLNHGRAVLTDGRAVLCDECPCGCRYTYYVDHSLAISGDGHSWETAFKSVNDVFNSLEIYNYRLLGCSITVNVRGNITYIISGSYLYTTNSTLFENYIIVQSENENHIEAKTISGTGYYFIEFKRIRFLLETYSYLGKHKITFSDCILNSEWGPNSGSSSLFLFRACNYLVFNTCTVAIETINNGYIDGINEVFMFFLCNYCEFYNFTANITANLSGNGGYNTATFSIMDNITYCIVENITTKITGILYQPSIVARAFRRATNCSISNLNASYSISSSIDNSYIMYCNFHGGLAYQAPTAFAGTVFYNCTQYCYQEGTPYNNNFECDYVCLDIS